MRFYKFSLASLIHNNYEYIWNIPKNNNNNKFVIYSKNKSCTAVFHHWKKKLPVIEYYLVHFGFYYYIYV